MKEASKTAKCPTCGNKYLVDTNYCVSCKKKVKDMKKENVLEIKEDVKIGDIILEKGDKIRVLESITSIDVDIMIDSNEVKDYIKDMDNKFNIIGTVIDLDGHNGNPEINFTGKESDLADFYVYYNGGDESMRDDFYQIYR